MIYDLFLIISRSNKYVMDPSCLSTCSTCCFIIWILFGGVSTCHFIVRRLFSVNFWTLVRGHRVQIIVPQGGWHLQFIDPQGGWHPPFYTIKWQVGPPPWKVTPISSSSSSLFNYILSLLAIIVIITKASVSSLESSCFSTYSGAPQGHHVIFPAKGPPLPPPPYISLLYIIYQYIIVASSLGRTMPRHDDDSPSATHLFPSFFLLPR